ncbi:PAS domain S-box protein [Desulfamplus magnetovallimortis]|nr:PAS domain S-box protein [Desulfamplus magnetovallimortis]
MSKSYSTPILILAIFFISIYQSSSYADNNIPLSLSDPIIKSASELDYPPFALVLDNGSADGFSVDLLKAVVTTMGRKINFKVGPWHKIKQQLIDGELDVLPLVAYSEERNKLLDFTAPFMRLHGTVFVRKGDNSIFRVSDLKGKEVLVMQGDNAHEYAVQNQLTDKLILTDNYEQAMQLLSSGKHDAVLMLQLVGFQLLNKLKITNVVSIHSHQETNIRPGSRPLSGYEQKFCFAVHEGDKELLSLLNEGLAIVIANGSYNELYDKWFGPILPQPRVSWKQILKYLFFILVPLLFLAAAMGIWYLRREVASKTNYLQEEIRERKQTEKTLHDSENKFRTLFDVAAIPLCYVNNKGVILDFNLKFTEVFGYTKSDVPTLEEWWVLAYPDPKYRKWVIKTWETAVEKAQKENTDIQSVEYRVTCKNGDLRDIIISGSTFQEYFLATFIDLTELKQAEERFEKFFTLISDLFCIADINGYFRLINPAAEQILGYTQEELLQRPYMNFVHPDDREKTEKVIHEQLQQGKKVINFSNRYVCKDGSVKWLEWTFHPMPNQGVTYAVGRDCTQRRDMEASLKASELWMRSIYNALEEAVLVVSPQRELISVNKATKKIFGYTEKEIHDQSTSILHVDQDHFVEFGKKIEDAFGQGKSAEFEFRAKRKNGEIFQSEHTVSMLKDEAGNPLGIVSVIRDISKRKQAEIILEETLADLEKSNAELEQFAYVASHDLQEPLRAVIGFLQLLQSKYKNQLDEKGRHYIERVVKAGHRMQSLISDLLKVSRVNTLNTSFEPTDLTKVLEEVLEHMQSTITEENGVVTYSRLPTLMVDKSQIQGLFQNLIVNALKYNEALKPTIEIGYEDKGHECRFFVKDNGIGISKEFRDKIFMIFQRLHPRKDYSGSGIGLALCKKIVERHRGNIWVESESGKGSIFYFTLPQGEK